MTRLTCSIVPDCECFVKQRETVAGKNAHGGKRKDRRCRSWGSGALDDDCAALSAADAQGSKSQLRIALDHLVDQGYQDTVATGTDRMSQSDGSAVHVQLVHVDAKLLAHCNGLSGKRLVRLDQVERFLQIIFFGERIDDDKRPSIYISYFNGGYGREWLDKIVGEYNAERTDNKYKTTIRASKDEFNVILSQLQSGTAIYDMFITNSYMYKMIDAGLVEDISDVWDSTPAGSDRSIRNMMTGSENYAVGYGDGKGGIYALPVYEGIRGFVYDHELFKKFGLLYNDAGQFIASPDETLSAGKDGEHGTYDDGHPMTEAQWEAMVLKATQTLGYAFNYSGKFSVYVKTYMI